MGSFVANTLQQQKEMLEEIGKDRIEALFEQIPDTVRLKEKLNLPSGLSELEVVRRMAALAEKNRVYRHIFRGAGAYNHYIPAAVKSIAGKEEFLTAYTPYQPEISQGILQAIFEYQTMICELTGMDAANASIYDGACAAAEGAAMCLDRKRRKVLVSAAVHPMQAEVIRTYCFGNGAEMIQIPEKDGKTDLDALKAVADKETACFYACQPNFYGMLEDYERMGRILNDAGARFILGCNPISLAILKTPVEYGADIAVGDGQPLGMPLGFGGPYLGFMAVKTDLMRKLPGRIVGETRDLDGQRAYVLTLQAREQHIRREKAGSNICSNQAHCALTASVYMAVMGTSGMEKAAIQCVSKAHYLQKGLDLAGLKPKYPGEFFHEFVTVSHISSSIILNALESRGILGGLPLNENEILWCCTELNRKEDMDLVIETVEEVFKNAADL